MAKTYQTPGGTRPIFTP